MTLLAFETSCDETSAAVIRDGGVLSSVVSSQIRLHAEYGGVVPELAAREHLRNLQPVVQTALAEARITAADVTAVAATQGPGLPMALMVGLKAAQAFAFAARKPFVGVHHHEAHLYSPWIVGRPPRADFENFQPNVSLIVSGGHTMLVHVASELQHHVLGATMDDAAGECFDKTGKLLGLAYPAGPIIDRLAEQGNPEAFQFPRPLRNDDHHDFSFSGLKTSVRYFLRDHPGLADDPRQLRDLCASVQAAIVDVLVTKTIRAARKAGVNCVTASGGVTCNRALRAQLEAACRRAGLTLRLADASLCTDNAAMVGILAERKLRAGVLATSFDEEIRPNWSLA
ncbi:MAG TPA: tRNA (adenosine(37)-N6)-threonylcarbamoyltransferase complex transferase subunit TsaD [Verrucomicrobiae bacterium]|nr:tRNA (adenosine(37)-N6)-threonylcarbamoyltransferase complex transferase subunit TsaD [Verrucomicrobiae bacterium]